MLLLLGKRSLLLSLDEDNLVVNSHHVLDELLVLHLFLKDNHFFVDASVVVLLVDPQPAHYIVFIDRPAIISEPLGDLQSVLGPQIVRLICSDHPLPALLFYEERDAVR